MLMYIYGVGPIETEIYVESEPPRVRPLWLCFDFSWREKKGDDAKYCVLSLAQWFVWGGGGR